MFRGVAYIWSGVYAAEMLGGHGLVSHVVGAFLGLLFGLATDSDDFDWP